MVQLINFKAFHLFRHSFKQQQLFGFAFNLIFLLGILAFTNAPVFAQGPVNGGFEGKVLEKGTGKPLAGAVVQFINNANGFQTAKKSDQNGTFRQNTLQPGVYLIRVTLDGYKMKETSQELYATRSNALIPVPVELEKEETVAVVTTPDPTPVVTNPDNGQPVTTPSPTNTPTITPTTIQVEKVTSDTDAGANLNPRRDAAFNANLVSTLPLGGTTLTRSFDELALLAPGVAPPPQAIGNSVGPGVGGGVGTSGQFSVNGLRSRANNFTVDGSDNNDEDIGVRRQGFFSLVPQPIESIQEFQIITLLAPAEFGRNLGAQVNALSKSGGNKFSGTIYGLFNEDSLNSRNFFDTTSGDTTTALTGRRSFDGASIPVFINGQQPSVRNDAGEKDQFRLLHGGFAIGGPIFRDKIFFFVSGEGEYLNGTRERNFAVPTVEQRGLFNSGVTGLQQCQDPNLFISGICQDTNGNPVNFVRGFPTSFSGDAVFSLFPFANNPNGVYGRNTYTQALSTDARGRILSGKIDYNLFQNTERPQTLTARYNYTDDRRDLTDVGGAIFSAIRPLVRTDNFSTYLTGGLTSNLSNEFRFSWGRTRLEFEELRDTTGFLRPVSNAVVINEQDKRFLLNAPVLFNLTIPSSCTPIGCFAPNIANYGTIGNLTTDVSPLGEIGQLIVAGFSPVGVDVFNFPQQRVNNTFQFADTLRWLFNAEGQHGFSFGADIRRTLLDSDLPRNNRPLVTFNGGVDISQGIDNISLLNPLNLASTGAASGFFQSLVLPDSKGSAIKLGYYQLNFFAQDEWRVRSNLNLNFGVRYEYNTTPKEADNKIEEALGQTPPSFLPGLSAIIDGRTSIYEGDRNNFAPRLGVAFAPTSSTVIRGGAGVYFDQIIGAVVSQSRNLFPNFLTTNFGGGVLIDNNGLFTLFNARNGVFDPVNNFVCNRINFGLSTPCGPNSIPLLQPGTLNTINPSLNRQQVINALLDIFLHFPENGNGGPFGITLPTRELDTPQSFQYSIGVEQKLFRDTFLSVAYVGTSGRKLLRFTTPNLGSNYVTAINTVTLTSGCDPTVFFGCDPQLFGTTFTPFNGSEFRVPFDGVGPVNRFETTGESLYDSLQIGLRGRLVKNKFQYQVSYVYGKVQDNVSDVFDLAGAFALPQNSLTFAGEYAPANFDVRHRFTYSFIYDLPGLRNQNSALRYLFGDWQIAGTGKYNTGQPFTVNSIYDVNLDGNLTDRLNSTRFITVTGNGQQPLLLANVDTTTLLAPLGQDGVVPRNSFRAGSLLDLDLSFVKRFVIREGQYLQFRTDIFNFINHANFGIPVRFLEAPGFGRATDTVTPGRRIQFALKYIF